MTRTTQIELKDDVYTVNMYIDNKLIEARSLPGHSKWYAYSCADNFILGIIYPEQLELDFG
jgi:hypothetical protein